MPRYRVSVTTAATVFVSLAMIATVLSGLDYLWRYRGCAK
jgi:hypothetical protein